MLSSSRFVCVLAIALLCGLASGHQDTRLSFEENEIEGLPEEFSPATFDPKSQTLIIAGKKLTFPRVLRDLFTYDASEDPFGETTPDIKPYPYKYSFAASWYHDSIAYEGGLPPYMLITVAPEGENYRFSLLVDMKRLEFIRADIEIRGINSVPIDLDRQTDKLGEQTTEAN